MSMNFNSSPYQATPPLNEDEIDLRQVAATLARQKLLIGSITAAAVLLSGIYAFTRKPVWKGQFQIVLETDSGISGRLAQLTAGNPILSGLADTSGGEGSLKTEVKILESPSVLKPVYDFVKVSKAASGEDVSNWVYTNWIKNNLNIELLQGTSVLSLAYSDTDQDLILPVLGRITQTYQEYSGKDRRRGHTQGVAYLEQEIVKLQQQSTTSMRTVQAYALANGLGIQDGMPTSADAIGKASSGSSVETSRETTQNNVNALRQRIAATQRSGNTTVYKAPQLEANIEIYSQLQAVETELQRKSVLLTPQDQSIQRLKRERRGLVAYINQQTIGLLQGELITAEAQLASLTRPREVVLKHRELVRAALRDEATLAELEVQFQGLKLEQARQTDPWELISTPTILDTPVAPRKKQMVALGLLAGLVLGCGAALIRDRRSGLVFSEDELKALLPCHMLERLPANAPEHWSATAELLAQGPLAQAQSIALIPVGNLPNNQVAHLEKYLSQALGNRRLLVTRDLLSSRNCSTQVLVTAIGASQRQQLQQLREQLSLQGSPLAGWLLINPALEK